MSRCLEDEYIRTKAIGQGTFGTVFQARNISTNELVAVKRIATERETNGFPLTALREIKILKALHHDNVIQLKDVVVSKGEYCYCCF